LPFSRARPEMRPVVAAAPVGAAGRVCENAGAASARQVAPATSDCSKRRTDVDNMCGSPPKIHRADQQLRRYGRNIRDKMPPSAFGVNGIRCPSRSTDSTSGSTARPATTSCVGLDAPMSGGRESGRATHAMRRGKAPRSRCSRPRMQYARARNIGRSLAEVNSQLTSAAGGRHRSTAGERRSPVTPGAPGPTRSAQGRGTRARRGADSCALRTASGPAAPCSAGSAGRHPRSRIPDREARSGSPLRRTSWQVPERSRGPTTWRAPATRSPP